MSKEAQDWLNSIGLNNTVFYQIDKDRVGREYDSAPDLDALLDIYAKHYMKTRLEAMDDEKIATLVYCFNDSHIKNKKKRFGAIKLSDKLLNELK